MRLSIVGILTLAGLLVGCAQDDLLRTEGLTLTAGDSIARNSALQIIDPWPAGVEDTNLSVPADRGGGVPTKGAADAPSTTATNP